VHPVCKQVVLVIKGVTVFEGAMPLVNDRTEDPACVLGEDSVDILKQDQDQGDRIEQNLQRVCSQMNSLNSLS